MAGKKGRSGRKKSVYHVYADWVEAARTNGTVAKIMDKLTELALNGDKDAGFYIVDRCEGKARISIDQRIHGALVSATPEDYKRAAELMLLDKEAEKALLNPGETGASVAEKEKYLLAEVAG